MNCPRCGTGLENGAHFCGVCGYRLDAAPPAARPQAQPRLPAQPQVQPQARPVGGVTVPSKPRPVPVGPAKFSPPVPTGDPYIGQTLNNRFVVESKLGEGGFGAVYRGKQMGTGRAVAIKMLHPEMTRDENLIARFRREGLVLCNLKDAHTITTYDFDQTPEGILYIAMELLSGKSLHDVFREEAPIDWKRMFKILSAMCSSLAEAHSQGIVHRDLKPENIHLENRPGNPEFVKILDFGIAKVMQGETLGGGTSAPQLTATGQTLGTLEYMSPEQLMGKALDGRSDVYAMGVLAYELCTGRLPFPDAKGPAQLITAQLRQTPDPPSKANPGGGMPPAVDACVLRMLEKDKNKRFPDVTALRAELERLVASGGGGLAVATPTPALDITAVPTPQMQAQLHAAIAARDAGQPVPVPRASTPPPPFAPPGFGPPTPPPVGPGSLSPPTLSPHGPGTLQPHNQPIAAHTGDFVASGNSKMWLWIALLAIVVVGGAVGAVLALR
jgi:serine/threonine protein kinase